MEKNVTISGIAAANTPNSNNEQADSTVCSWSRVRPGGELVEADARVESMEQSLWVDDAELESV